MLFRGDDDDPGYTIRIVVLIPEEILLAHSSSSFRYRAQYRASDPPVSGIGTGP